MQLLLRDCCVHEEEYDIATAFTGGGKYRKITFDDNFEDTVYFTTYCVLEFDRFLQSVHVQQNALLILTERRCNSF